MYYNNYYFSREGYNPNPYGLNFSRSYSRVVAYNFAEKENKYRPFVDYENGTYYVDLKLSDYGDYDYRDLSYKGRQARRKKLEKLKSEFINDVAHKAGVGVYHKVLDSLVPVSVFGGGALGFLAGASAAGGVSSPAALAAGYGLTLPGAAVGGAAAGSVAALAGKVAGAISKYKNTHHNPGIDRVFRDAALEAARLERARRSELRKLRRSRQNQAEFPEWLSEAVSRAATRASAPVGNQGRGGTAAWS